MGWLNILPQSVIPLCMSLNTYINTFQLVTCFCIYLKVLISLDATKKLLQASQGAPPQCDYHQLIGQLSVSPGH